MGKSRKTLVYRTALFFGVLVLCFVLIHYGRLYAVLAWGSLRLVNVVVNLTPTLLAILFAFVVDKDLAGRLRWRWLFRIFVVSCGACLSGLLWHQQALADIQSDRQIQHAVDDAVEKANKHSDAQFSNVQTKVGQIDSEVKTVGQQITDVEQHVDTQTGEIGKGIGDISANLGKVGKPDPPPIPRLTFSFADGAFKAQEPLHKETIKANSDGSYSFKFTLVNNSDVNAEEVDVWISICQICEFLGEPKGSDHAAGEEPQKRHFAMGSIHAGVAREPISVTFKSKNPPANASYGVAFAYACKTCEKPKDDLSYVLLTDPSAVLPK